MLRQVTIALCLVAWAAPSAAQQHRPVSTIDPFVLNGAGIRDTLNCDVNAKTLRSQTTNPAVATLVMMIGGQSNTTGIGTGVYVPTNASVIDNFNLCDGAIYSASAPLVGTGLADPLRTNHQALPIADKFVASGKFARVIIVPFGFGGSTIDDWANGPLKGRFTVAMRRLAQRGIVSGTNVTFVVMFAQGEGDTQLSTSQAVWTSKFNIWAAEVRAAGYAGPVFVARETHTGTTSAAIQAAQTQTTPAGVIDHPNGIWEGADADSVVGNICGPTGTAACVQSDQTHFTGEGQYTLANHATYGWPAKMALYGAPF